MSAGFNSPRDMAKSLVTYMDDPKAIRAAILDNFLNSPSIKSICAYRGAYLRQVQKAKRGKKIGSHDKHDIPSPGADWQKDLVGAVDKLAAAIWREHGPMLIRTGVTPPGAIG